MTAAWHCARRAAGSPPRRPLRSGCARVIIVAVGGIEAFVVISGGLIDIEGWRRCGRRDIGEQSRGVGRFGTQAALCNRADETAS